MKRLMKRLWASLMADAPKDESGCGRGGMCRHQDNCGDLYCPGHPQNNIYRSEDDDEIRPPGWGYPIVPPVVVWTIALGAGIVTLVRWLVG